MVGEKYASGRVDQGWRCGGKKMKKETNKKTKFWVFFL